MKLLKNLTYLLLLTLLFISCSSDDDSDDIIVQPLGDYENGILITNEGPFGTGTGTINFITNDYQINDSNIFSDVNQTDLGNIVQSMSFNGVDAFIVVNNSHKIEVVNRYTFESIATIVDGLDNPRYFVAVNGTGYVSNWGDPFDESDDYIALIDLDNFTVTGTIAVGFGPEKIVERLGSVYIAHQGGFGQNNKVTVINSGSNTITNVIEVGDVPNSMVVIDNSIWVLCGGKPSYTGDETNGRLVKLNPDSNTIVQSFDFNLIEHPSQLTLDGTNLIYSLDGAVFSMDALSTTIPTQSIITGFFYSMTAHNGKLYTTDAGDFASNGFLKIYDLSSNSELQSFEVGIIPGGVYFNE
jgi:hypothetical protein